jgi:hypothetical protein
MENFARFIQNIKEDDGRDVQVRETVKIALIDDGIDTEHFYEYITCGVSFCGSESGGRMRGYYVATGGHGTLMASSDGEAVHRQTRRVFHCGWWPADYRAIRSPGELHPSLILHYLAPNRSFSGCFA